MWWMEGCFEISLKQIRPMVIQSYAVEPPNKGHFGDDINSADLFFVERFSSWGGVKMYCRNYTGTVSLVLCREFYYTYLGESTNEGSAVYPSSVEDVTY